MGEFVIPKAGRIQGSPWAPLHLLDSHEYHGGNGAEWRGWVLQSSGEGTRVATGMPILNGNLFSEVRTLV